jgi:hypothetical protein
VKSLTRLSVPATVYTFFLPPPPPTASPSPSTVGQKKSPTKQGLMTPFWHANENKKTKTAKCTPHIISGLDDKKQFFRPCSSQFFFVLNCSSKFTIFFCFFYLKLLIYVLFAGWIPDLSDPARAHWPLHLRGQVRGESGQVSQQCQGPPQNQVRRHLN